MPKTKSQAITRVPCSNCPFRMDVPIYLRAERRREIAASLLRGAQFPCHKTTEYDEEEDDMVETPESLFCAGAAKSMLQVGLDNQMLRVIERLGMADLEVVEQRGPAVWGFYDWQKAPMGATADAPDGDGEDDEEEFETCSVVGPNCIAPAGYAIGGGAVRGDVEAEYRCVDCGEAVCGECRDEAGRCGHCIGDDWEGWDG